MCWMTNKSCNRTIKVAKKDIEVFKILFSDGIPYYWRNSIRYTKGTLCPLIPLPDALVDDEEIKNGYHSYSKKYCYAEKLFKMGAYRIFNKASEDDIPRQIDFYPVAKYKVFVIPKGTRYYENEKGEIVSETIMMQ